MTAVLRWLPRAALALVFLGAACSDDGGATIEVAAASSLRHVLPRIVEDFERSRPSANIELRFNGSQILATQIKEGASTDLFVSANPRQAQRLVEAGRAKLPTVVAANRLVIGVNENAPWESVEELSTADVRIAVGAPTVPVGALTALALAQLDPTARRKLQGAVVTEDPSVRIVLSRLEIGEVDAAFVYESDIEITPELRALPLPATVPLNNYVAVLVGDGNADAAELLAFLLGPGAQALFQAAGFERAVVSVEAR